MEHATLVLHDPAMIEHDPGPEHPERPDRLRAIDAILDAVGEGRFVVERPSPIGREALERVHDPRHIDRVLALHERHATLDPDTHVSPRSIDAAKLAAGAAVGAIDALFAPDPKVSNAFALVRPPGHHAEADRAMGFCLFNNIAVAAAHARATHGVRKILIVDWDVHHGNGTQHMFEHDPDTLFFSVHQAPFYPGTGALREVGRGAGEGSIINVPLSGEANDADYRLVFDELLQPVADAFAPELVLVSAGFDAHRQDPLGGMCLTEEGFADLCGRVLDIARSHAHGRLALLLEGGYDLQGLAQSVLACLQVMGGVAPPGAGGERTTRAEAEIGAAIAHHRRYWDLG